MRRQVIYDLVKKSAQHGRRQPEQWKEGLNPALRVVFSRLGGAFRWYVAPKRPNEVIALPHPVGEDGGKWRYYPSYVISEWHGFRPNPVFTPYIDPEPLKFRDVPTHEELCQRWLSHYPISAQEPLPTEWFCAPNTAYLEKDMVTACTQSDLPTYSSIPGRIRIDLDIGGELSIFPDILTFWPLYHFLNRYYPLRYHPKTHTSTGWISSGPIKSPIVKAYLPPDTRLYAAHVGLTPGVRRRVREANGRTAYGEHNERFQAIERRCSCGSDVEQGGTIRYDEHLALICDDCQAFHGYKMATDEFMNGHGEEEDSGDDDTWKVAAYKEQDYDIPREKTFNRHVNRQQLDIWESGQREAYGHARNTHRFDPAHKNDYIKHDTRKQKNKFLDDRICLILSGNGNGGMEQSEIHCKLKPLHGEVISYSSTKTAINRMEKTGRIKSWFVYDGRKIKKVRLVAKT